MARISKIRTERAERYARSNRSANHIVTAIHYMTCRYSDSELHPADEIKRLEAWK
jgi:hypothetical protein